jgi:DNA mismatch repair protein MutS
MEKKVISNINELDYSKLTPMMKQFVDLKREYSDSILLFRAGDFYETFFEDAKIASKVLGITLTSRGGVIMAGVPYHSITPYIKKLVQNNYKVAICEQLEDPKQAKGVVKRGITRVITPGTIIEDDYLSSIQNNFLMCIYDSKNKKELNNRFGISIVDVSTGEFIITELSEIDELKSIIKKYQPNEIILNEESDKKIINFIKNQNIYYNFLSSIRFNEIYAKKILETQFKEENNLFIFQNKKLALISSGALLFYVNKLQKLNLEHIKKVENVNIKNYLVLDSISIRNLELFESFFSKDKEKTLYGILNETKTAFGARLLKKILINPLTDKEEINKRLDAIEEFNSKIFERDRIREILDEFYDIERIASRISTLIATPKDLISLKNSLKKLPILKEYLSDFNSELFLQLKKFNEFKELVKLIESSINEDDAKSHTRDIGYIKKDFNPTLKELFDIAFNSKEFLAGLEENERLKTGIPTLKIKYNKVFGYFIEIPKAQSNKVPENYVPTQTLTNTQRYTTPELKEKENLILSSEEKIKELEKEIYNEILYELKKHVKELQEISKKIAWIDIFSTNSYLSQIYNYTRPKFNENKTEVYEGRNPIVERFTENYIPNDIYFDENEKIKIITGPNMSGKSTYLREVALITIIAQTGLFIPAKNAKLKIYDKVFTRIGAYDELASGQSTFMVEMSETANILNNATENSLVLLDEIGRGTSTYDGLAIAWAVIEYLYELNSDVVFATHYHYLNELEKYYSKIINYHVLVKEEGENIEFLRKIVKGGTDKSYGIYVAKIAGVPKKVIERAKEVQENIETKQDISIKSEFKENMKKRSKKIENSKKLNEFF